MYYLHYYSTRGRGVCFFLSSFSSSSSPPLSLLLALLHFFAHPSIQNKGFQGYKLPFQKRAEIRQLIGAKAERLVWMFCVVDRFTVGQTSSL